MSPRREYGATIAILVVAAIAVIASYGATWITATVPVFRGEPTPTRLVSLTGSMLIGTGAAAGWVAVACTAGIVATRSWGRVAIGIVAAVAGAAAGIPAVTFILSRGPLVTEALDGDEAIEVAGNAWWLIAAVSGLAVLVAGSVTALRGRAWPTLSSRYERAPSAGSGESSAGGPPMTSAGVWDALDRGEDPTRDDAQHPGADDGQRR